MDSFVHVLGIYKYGDVQLIADFKGESYMNNKLNNSSAHLYSFDLQKAFDEKIFRKTDYFGNIIDIVSFDKFEDYLNSNLNLDREISIFKEFNKIFISNTPLYSIDCIKKMHKESSPNWRQTEWVGFYLEHEFQKFINKKNYNRTITFSKKFIGSLDKSIDIDLWFPRGQFYGDLKASDIKRKETPGNDQITVDKAIAKYGKLWYIIYEHETVKDKDYNVGEYFATKQRNKYISKIDKKTVDELSYKNRMKHSVIFKSMSIIEINKYNIHLLKDFNQGKQQGGDERKIKYNIQKRVMKEFVIYSYK